MRSAASRPGLAVAVARAPWHDVPIYEGRDLASTELWELSLAVARAKRQVARHPPRLPKVRRASLSLVVAAVAAATPTLGLAHSRSSGKPAATTRALDRALLKRGDRGAAVARLQRALGVAADGIFGPRTAKAVRAFQRRAGLVVDGVVGPQTRAALAAAAGGRVSSGGSGETHAHPDAAPARRDVDPRLGPALALARELGLELISAHRPGAIIESSGRPSDHGAYPSKAIDLHGSAAAMKRYARAVAGMPGVETVIHSPVGIWLSGVGWRAIRTSVTYDSHLDHVHVDTF